MSFLYGRFGERFRRRPKEPPPFDPPPYDDIVARPFSDQAYEILKSRSDQWEQIRMILLSWDPPKRLAFEQAIAREMDQRAWEGRAVMSVEEYRLAMDHFDEEVVRARRDIDIRLTASGGEEAGRALRSLGSFIGEGIERARIGDNQVHRGEMVVPNTLHLQSGTGVWPTSPGSVPRETPRRPDVPEQRMYVDDEE